MACCGGTKIPNIYDKEGLLKRLRSIDGLDIDMKLSKFDLNFDQETGTWRNNFSKETPIMETKYDEEIKILKQKINEKELRCEELEKLYLAKAVRLLYMAQTHCQLKSENDKLFEYYGIKTGNLKVDLDKILANPKDNINIENDKNPKENKEESKEESKEAVPA